MGVDENKALIRRFYEEVWGKGDETLSAEVFRDDYVRHDLRPAAAEPGAAGQTKIALDFRRAIPDLVWRVDLILGDGEYVVGRWTATGTQTGPWGAIEPTGKPIEFSGVNIFRFEGGKVAEIWNHRDDLGFMTQLGAVVISSPTPGRP
jgi:predicted ester cyclase